MWTYRAAPHRVIDGDTIEVMVELGFGVQKIERIRIADIDCPELNQPGGQAAKSAVEVMLGIPRNDWALELIVRKTRTGNERRTFGRLVAEVLYMDAGGGKWNLGTTLVRKGHARQVV